MIEFLESLFIPNVGAYTTGIQVELHPELESQLVAAGKAKRIDMPVERVVHATKGFEPGLTDD